MIGAISFDQDFETAIAAAVVGPPIHALETKIASSKSNFNNFAAIKVTIIFNTTIIKQNTNNKGDSNNIDDIEAGAPITTKNK